MITGSGKKLNEATAQRELKRRLPVGAEFLGSGGVHFRVWAPSSQKVEVVIEAGMEDRYPETPFPVKLDPEQDGYFSGTAASAAAGMLYRFRLDSGEEFLPDPASRFQPDGPHGLSEIVDPTAFTWTDTAWQGVVLPGQVIYEMHIGTFTKEGTWNAAAALLPRLTDTGVTLLEIMPVADFPGGFGWGYDCVDFYAPTRLYGRPDDFRAFVNRAHELGLGVILDVVYNHQGPDGCYLPRFSKDYFTDRYKTEWGSAFNYDGEHSAQVRDFIVSNAGYWIDEFHLDGLRIDATQSIIDRSPEHILAAIVKRVKQAAAGRSILVTAENEPQDTIRVRPVVCGGYGIDAVWNDDFHHSARVALTGRTEAYYTDYRGTAQELLSAVKWGYLYQGQYYLWQGKQRGTSAIGLRPETFVIFIQNHDQIANTGKGTRIHQLSGPGMVRAMTALLLLAPGTPLLFQGQEFAASAPFLYFADHEPGLERLVRHGRKEFLAQFPSLAVARMQNLLADPGDQATFERSKLDHSERERNAEALTLHRDLIRLRKQDPVFSGRLKRGLDGAVLGPEALVLRFFGIDGEDRLLLVNLGRDLCCEPTPEPLLAPPAGKYWEAHWSSEDPVYGGNGTPSLERSGENWRIPANSAVVLMARTM
jgi:maltooligosyltrehalose trehalohydrolase